MEGSGAVPVAAKGMRRKALFSRRVWKKGRPRTTWTFVSARPHFKKYTQKDTSPAVLGIGTFFQGVNNGFVSVARTLGRLAIIAQRPNFELQFSILQNKLIDQLAEKIEKLNDKSVVNNVDVFLELEKKRLQRLSPLVDRFKNQTFMNLAITNGVIDNLSTLKALASGSDATAFDNLLAKIDKELLSIRKVSGLAIGFNVRDGLLKVRDEGLGISNFSSYADATEREDAVTAAKSKLESGVLVLLSNLDAINTFQESVGSKLASVTLQIEAVQLADTGEKIAEIKKLREKHSQFLTALSLAFEINQARAELLTGMLLDPPRFGKGTVLDIIT